MTKTHYVYFQPIAVTQEVADELNTQDPLGMRAELEVELLKGFCPTPVFSVTKREPFPIIAAVVPIPSEEEIN